jgi:hypothetical protein
VLDMIALTMYLILVALLVHLWVVVNWYDKFYEVLQEIKKRLTIY